MATRFDNGVIRKSVVTPEGYLRADAVFARDGVLEYRTPSGEIRRELRLPEENKKALTGFGLKPFTIEHPSVLVDSQNAGKFTKGLTDSTVVYDEGGFVRGVINVFDSLAVDSIKSGKTVEISSGYQCDVVNEPGIWNGERYDAIQRNLVINHICATQKGRAGADVRIHLDSFDALEDVAVEINNGYWNSTRLDSAVSNSNYQPLISNKKMAKFNLDGVEYTDIPEGFASAISQKITELTRLNSRVDSLTQDNSEIPVLKEQLKEANAERDRQMGRADGYEEIVSAALPILESEGYHWDSDEQIFKQDGKKMPMEDEEGDWEDEEDEESEEEPEEEMPPKKSKKDKKKDSDRADSVGELLTTWKDAEKIIPGISESKFDSALDSAGVRRLVVSEYTKKDFADKSDDYIASRYDSIKETLSDRQNSGNNSRFVDELTTVVTTRSDAKKACDCNMSETDKKRADNYKKPIGMSKSK